MLEETPTVYVIGQDASVRKAVDRLVLLSGFRVQKFASATDFLLTTLPNAPGCLVLDVRLPGLSGLDLQRELTRASIQVPIIFVTGFGDIPMSVRAMKAGAIEFLTKPFCEQTLVDAILQAIQGDRIFKRKKAEMTELRDRFQSLTPRQGVVMQLVVSGLLNKQIAAELGISEITVKLQRGQVMHRMQAGSLPDLVRMAEKLRIPVVSIQPILKHSSFT